MNRYLAFSLAVGLMALPGVAFSKGDAWGLFLDFGAPADASAFPPIASDFAALANHLSGLTGSPKEHFVVAPVSSRANAQETLRNFAARVPAKSLVYIYVRAYITKPPTENAVYFYPPGASLKSPMTASPKPIRDSEFSEWLSPFRASETFLLFDLRTTVEPLGVFHGNRTLLGTYALTVIARRPLAGTMAALLRRAFVASADGDNDGALRPDELTDAFQEQVYTGGITSSDAIVALTGAPDKILTTFPAALKIESRPAGATVILDGKEVGKTPLIYKNLAAKRYTVDVSLHGYRSVSPQTVDVTRLIGKGYSVLFTLEPVRIRGTVKVPPNVSGVPIVLTVRPDVGLTAPLSGTGVFEFDTKDAYFAPDKEYRVIAATVDDRFFGDAKLTFTGHDDVDVAITLKERTAWEVAAIRFAAGFRDEALESATQARNAAYDIPELPEDFARFLIERWSTKTESARALIGCALLSLQLGDSSGSQAYWRMAKRVAKKGSPDYEYAVRGLRTYSGDSLTYGVAAILLLLVLASLAYAIRRHRTRSVGA
jgi:hypothetical protein